MASLEEIRNTRLEKLAILKKNGIDPYPAESKRDFSLQEVTENFEKLSSDLENESDNKKSIFLVGRIMSLRAQGGLQFFDLYDGTGKLQALLKKEENTEKIFDLFSQTVDIGDFVQVEGTLFVTKRGEKTIQVKDWRILSKSLRPLPEKWHGLQDVEERLRNRYLDILFNPEVRKTIEKKALFWDFTRNYLKSKGFLEVETPTLELTTGGAEARPFKTHHNDYDIDVYLRISVGELWQKRLLAAGLPKVFEVGRVYRNEGTSPEHTQEFTNLEFYSAYMDYNQGIVFTESMIKELAQNVFGTMKFASRGFEFDLNGEWKKLDYVETVEKMTGINVLEAGEDQMKKKLHELKVEYEGKNKERLIDSLWKYCRKQIAGPAWLINHPKIVSPLSKSRPDNSELTERVQLILAGAEVTNGFSELNNPIDQKERFETQQKLIEKGDAEAMMPDMEFVEMLEHGMPPAFGFAYGDRLFAFLVDKPLRETQIFPFMRPVDQIKKSKETKIAVAIINAGANLEMWQKMNAVAHVAAAFGARSRSPLFKYDSITTADEQKINLNIQHAIIIKEAKKNDDILNLIKKAKTDKLEISEFTREMLETTNDKKVVEKTKEKKIGDIEFLGVLIFGGKSKVEELTEKFPLLS